MKEIPKKNYIILVILLLVTIFSVLLLANLYISKNKLVSEFYEYSNKITLEDFDEYMIEHSDIIIYISDKYDLSHEMFEKELENKINEFNLKDNLIFVDKNDINEQGLEKLNGFGINIELDSTPIIVMIVDGRVIKSQYIDNYSVVDSIIDYEVFE